MNDRNNHDDAGTTPATDEGEYTDVETEDGRTTHQDDVTPGEYTDIDLGEGTTH